MIKQLEQEIQDLQKALAEVQKDQAGLRLEPCREIQKSGRRTQNSMSWIGGQKP